ncbi:hypothetical protein LDO48_02670 [Pantoea agglomerans]|nr:hypothetical protein [Pantoea agglomerans]
MRTTLKNIGELMNINIEDFRSTSIQNAWKYICQLRIQHHKNKTSLVLGAGISWDLDLPLWGGSY